MTLRPIPPGRLTMPAAFLGTWTALRLLGAGEDVAFVWAAVLAQAAQLWCVLPVTARRHREVFGRMRRTFGAAYGVLFALLAVQVWWSDPALCQRLLSLVGIAYAAVMLMGARGDADVLERFAPVRDDAEGAMARRRHALLLQAVMATLVVAANEALLIADAALGVRAVALALLAPALHYVHEVLRVLTRPAA